MPYISEEELTQLRCDSEVLHEAIRSGILSDDDAVELQLNLPPSRIVEEEDAYEAAHNVIPSDIRHPEVQVALIGGDGNAFAVLGAVGKALRRAGFGDEVSEFLAEASDGDYDHLLATCMRWVEVV